MSNSLEGPETQTGITQQLLTWYFLKQNIWPVKASSSFGSSPAVRQVSSTLQQGITAGEKVLELPLCCCCSQSVTLHSPWSGTQAAPKCSPRPPVPLRVSRESKLPAQKSTLFGIFAFHTLAITNKPHQGNQPIPQFFHTRIKGESYTYFHCGKFCG